MVEEIFITVPSDKATPAEIADFMSKLYLRDIQRVGRDNSAHAGKTAKAGHTPGVGDHSHQSAGAEGGLTDHGFAHTPASLGDDDHTLYFKADGTRALNGPLNHDGTTVGLYGAAPVAQAAAIADEAGTADATYSANEVDMLNNLKAKLNSVLAALRGMGVITT